MERSNHDLPLTPEMLAFKAKLDAWRALPSEGQIAQIGAMAPDRTPSPPGLRARVGIWCPCLHHGGAESWQFALARSVDASQVAWQGCCSTGGSGSAHEAALREMARTMPISAGLAEARALAARCEVLLSWTSLDPSSILAGLPHPPKVVDVLHFPVDKLSVRIPAQAFALTVAVSALAVDPSRPGCRVIWNAVDPIRLAPTRSRNEMRQSWGVPEHSRVVGYLGRLSEEKDPKAMARLAGCLPDSWHVVVVGDGRLRPELEQSDLPNLHTVGPDPSAGDVLRAFDYLMVPSRYDSFGLTLAEGLSLQIPSLATPVGLASLVPGLVREIPVGADGPVLASAVLADHADAAGTGARVTRAKAFASERLGLERFGREWTELLCEMTYTHRLARVNACPDRGGVLPPSMQDDCDSKGKELSECRAGKGDTPGRVTLQECLSCRVNNNLYL